MDPNSGKLLSEEESARIRHVLVTGHPDDVRKVANAVEAEHKRKKNRAKAKRAKASRRRQRG